MFCVRARDTAELSVDALSRFSAHGCMRVRMSSNGAFWHPTIHSQVRTVTDAVNRSLSGLKTTHGGRLGELEKVIKAEISARQKQQEATKDRLEGVVASITRAIAVSYTHLTLPTNREV